MKAVSHQMVDRFHDNFAENESSGAGIDITTNQWFIMPLSWHGNCSYWVELIILEVF